MAREVQRAVRPPRPSSIRTSLFPLLFTNVQNYKNNAHSVSRCQGSLIFQEKAIFRKDSRKNDCWTDGLGPTRSCNLLLVESSMEREIALHQRERRSGLTSRSKTPRPFGQCVLQSCCIPSSPFRHAQKLFCRSLTESTTTFSLLVRSFRKSYEGSTISSKGC